MFTCMPCNSEMIKTEGSNGTISYQCCTCGTAIRHTEAKTYEDGTAAGQLPKNTPEEKELVAWATSDGACCEWVKSLGQQHLATGVGALCGVPMSGNNYASRIKDDDKKLCYECALVAATSRRLSTIV